LTFERSRDYALISAIMRHPRLYGAAADDFACARESFEARQDEAIWYVMAYDGARVLGLFAICPQNAVTWEIHTRLLPDTWGAIATAAARAIVPWIWENTGCRRLVTACPSYNRLAVRFAERAGGMVRYGVNPASWLKDGQLFDQVLLGISKQ
jgi:RimJ/RimL family protein N-acetyltransferase